MVKFITPVIILFALAYSWLELKPEKSALPCTEPISYTIGTFDRRFRVSHGAFLKALAEAEGVWEQAIQDDPSYMSKELFSYSPEKATLPVNLVYDYRQEVTDELTTIEGKVEEDKEKYDRLQASYSLLKTTYAEAKSRYDERVSQFDQASKVYDEMVRAWNASSRTSKTQFNKLEEARLALEQDLAQIRKAEEALNQYVREVNTLVSQLNPLAQKLNLNVEEYNTIGASRGETFAGGIYTSDATGERIDIFEFSNHEKLVRVLAHELGHALGLDHVEDPQAIMYRLNHGEAGELASSDLSALKNLCGVN